MGLKAVKLKSGRALPSQANAEQSVTVEHQKINATKHQKTLYQCSCQMQTKRVTDVGRGNKPVL